MPKPGSKGHGKSGYLSDRLRQKALGGTLPFTFSSIARAYYTYEEDYSQLALSLKQVGVAAWLECWLSHLGVAGLSPGHDNL